MCDVKKYEKLQPEDTLQLVLEAETEEHTRSSMKWSEISYFRKNREK